MNKFYKKVIIFFTIILIFLFVIAISYFMWRIENSGVSLGTYDSCVEIIYSDPQTYNLLNPDSLSDSDGKSTLAKSISITNHCSNIKTIQLISDILDTSSIGSNKVKVYLNGDIHLEPTILSDLKVVKKEEENTLESRLLYKYDLEPEASIRLNLRFWIDEYAKMSSDKNVFNTYYEVVASDQIIKPTFKEKILKDNSILSTIDYRDSNVISGLYQVDSSYYFRGNPLNNYFKLDDYLFRIVGLDHNSIKLVYVTDSNYGVYNDYANKEEMTSFSSSVAREFLDTWYQENLSSYDEYFINGNYCSDSSYSKYYNQITYGANSRVFDLKTPSLGCLSGDKEFGGTYISKIGLLTADEMAIIGLSSDYEYKDSYIYTGSDVCSSSPYSYYYGAYIVALNNKGMLGYLKSSSKCDLLPVLNINGYLQIKGDGTLDNPYNLDLD